MPESLLASRYAKALFELALSMKKLEEVKRDMDLLQEVSKSNKDFRQLLKSPVIRADKKTAIFKALFTGRIQEITFKFMLLITRNRREKYLEEIARQFIILFKEHHHITTAYIKSAVKLSEAMKQKMTRLIEEYTNGKVELVEDIDEKLIGGFIINFQNKQFDASLLKQINRLKKEFESNPYVRGF